MFDVDSSAETRVPVARTTQENWGGIPEVKSAEQRVFDAELSFYKNPSLEGFRNVQQFSKEKYEAQAVEGSGDKWNGETQDVYQERLNAVDAVMEGKATGKQQEIVVNELYWMSNDIDPRHYDEEYYGPQVQPEKAQDAIDKLAESVVQSKQAEPFNRR